ncbi:MAG: beta family protein [Pseudomonadota bacterium]|nr:beta family protein [Pseudomonadota bacterium]
MNEFHRLLYCTALRMKAGELEGVRLLASDVAESVLPRFILPPKKERSDAEPLLIEMAEMPDISVALSAHWRDRPALIDASHIIDEYGRDRLETWLPNMFRRAWAAGVLAIPFAKLSDLGDAEIPAFKAAIPKEGQIKFAICVPSDDMVGPTSGPTIQKILSALGLGAAGCVVLADFSGAELSNPSIVSPIIREALETLQEIGPWRHIVFQGTHYPEVNPAKDGSVEIWPRNEWLAWKEAVKFDPSTAEHMLFGDYAADCAKMAFSGGGAPAIRHIRYATPDAWRVQRAVKEGKDAQRMHGVYKAIADSKDFAGEGFSSADAFIANGARNPTAGPGNSTTWRQLNTTHHITQVVTDIARVRGISINTAPGSEEVQLAFLT